MSGPFEEAENLFVFVERLRPQAEKCQRTIEAEFQTVRALIEELRIPSGQEADSRQVNGLM